MKKKTSERIDQQTMVLGDVFTQRELVFEKTEDEMYNNSSPTFVVSRVYFIYEYD